MAPRGRPPKSPAQHRAQGTYQPSRHAGRGVAPPADDDEGDEGDEAGGQPPAPALIPPKGLRVDERRAWEDLVQGRPWIIQADAPTVELAAVTLTLWRKAVRKVRGRDGMTHKTQYGRSIAPEFKVMRQLAADLRTYSTLLGLSPSDRARLQWGDGDEDDSFAGEIQRSVALTGGLKVVE